jgi:hypothetical protein
MQSSRRDDGVDAPGPEMQGASRVLDTESGEGMTTTRRTKFKIEKGIPIPSLRSLYPFDQMKVGDSFVVTGEQCKGIHQALYYQNTKSGMKFTGRKLDEGKYRVWRIK